MKAFLAPAVIALTAAAPAASSVMTVGGSYARSCYLAAEARSPSSKAMQDCNRAFTDQALSFHDRVATQVNRGILRLLAGDDRAAAADFDAAIALDPRQPEAWLNRGIVQYNRGDGTAARQMFTRAIELGTRDPALAYFARGLAHEDLGELRSAYADLSRARSLKPDWSPPAKELARYQVRRN